MTAIRAVPANVWQWAVRGPGAVGMIVWATRLLAVLALVSVLVPVGRRRLRAPLVEWLGLESFAATVAAGIAMAGAAVALLAVASALGRRMRRAWQLTLLITALLAVAHLVTGDDLGTGVAAATLTALLVVNRRQFDALPDPAVGRWRAPAVLVCCALTGVVVNLVVLILGAHQLTGRPSGAQRLWHAILALAGVTGPVRFRTPVLDDLTAAVGLLFGVGGLLLATYVLLRAGEPHPSRASRDESRLRALLGTHGGTDSLGYFTLRQDKSAVFSATGKAAVAYRVLAGVALASGDPIGDAEAWPGAIEAFRELCRRHGWIPAVLGCSRRGATVWQRHGLRVWELGDEAVVDTASFVLDGRPMRGVRQMVTRARRSGYRVRVRRASAVAPLERAALAERVTTWRGTSRGFSMALSRLAGPDDPDCVIVTAEHDGVTGAVLQLVPWGRDGLSLDLMCRDRAAPGGVNELMIAELLLACPGLTVRRVSLNFAVLRAALELGERIGAGPVARLWSRTLRVASRRWQIDSLYRFNRKFRPQWLPRYLAYPAGRYLPRVALAALEAEGFGRRPRPLVRLLRRP